MSWNIKTPGDFINGPLTVAGTTTFNSQVTVNSTLQVTGNVAGQGALIGRDGSSGGAVYSSNTGNTNLNAPASGKVRFNVNNGTFAGEFDTSGNLGVGVTPTSVFGQTRVEIKGSGSGNLTLRTASSNAAARDWQVACNLDTFGELNFRQGASTGAEPNSGTTRMVLTAAGDVSVSTGNVVMATSGKGIDFSAKTPDGSGTLGSEILNDYEEGTWVPVPTAGSGAFTSVTGAVGTYTKIGRMVTATAFFKIVLNGTANSFIQLAGLPFALGSMNNIGVGRVDATTGSMFQIKLNASSTIGNIWTYNNLYPGADGAEFPMTLVYYV
jgi:hypothetical protein